MPAPAGADALGKRALRIEFDLKFAGEILLGEQLVLAHIGRDHLFDLPRLKQKTKAGTVDAGIVRHDGEVLHAEVADRLDQLFRNAAKAEASGTDQHAVFQQPCQRRFCVGINFLHAALLPFLRLCFEDHERTPLPVAGKPNGPGPQAALQAWPA